MPAREDASERILDDHVLAEDDPPDFAPQRRQPRAKFFGAGKNLLRIIAGCHRSSHLERHGIPRLSSPTMQVRTSQNDEPTYI